MPFSKELAFVVNCLNPAAENHQTQNCSDLNEQRLIKILKINKLLTKFPKAIEAKPTTKQELCNKYPLLEKTLTDAQTKQTTELNEFTRISQKLAQNNIHLLLIKSEGTFPHESSNFDCLIPPHQVPATTKILMLEGYRELPLAREPHKYLFRKTAHPRELPLHIHTRVEWEAVEFAEADNLRRRSRPLQDADCGALTPSIEDAVLITIAHYFFEDHEIKLYDLLKLQKLLAEGKVDWRYIGREAERLSWGDALALNVDLLNRMSAHFFDQKLIKNAQMQIPQRGVFTKAVSFAPEGPLKIPYLVSATFFLRKVMRNPDCVFTEKSHQVIYVFSDILRRMSIGYMEP
jgi:hypothetical protein